MALATQCPHCHTTFKVAHDQLKLRAGLVRCGACKQIFNGIENLLRPEELEQSNQPTPPVVPLPAPSAVSAPLPPPTTETKLPAALFPRPVPMEAEPPPAAQPQLEPSTATEEIPPPVNSATDITTEAAIPPTPRARADDPLLRMTLLEVAHETSPATDHGMQRSDERGITSDGLEQTIEDLQSKPWRKKTETEEEVEGDALDRADAADYEEPAFVRQARRRQRLGRALHIVMRIGSVALLFGLVGQAAYIFRDQIAARFPDTRPVLVNACAYLNCQVGLPSRIESVSIESSELQTISANDSTFSLTVLLRNQGTTEQAWPNIELTLNDADEKPIARRVFTPREYLHSPQDISHGITANSEQPIKVFFELSQLKASGYRVYLFYP
jgi:predicted Zn finger-like uncharacterized protein